MADKYVQIDAHIEFPTGTVRTDQFASFNAEMMRNEVEAAVFGNKVDKIAKGTFKFTLNAKVRPDTDFVFLKYLIQQFNGDTSTAVLYRPKNAAKATGNPELTFDVMVTKVPNLGGDRGNLLEGDLQLQIVSPITYDDGAVTITVGG